MKDELNAGGILKGSSDQRAPDPRSLDLDQEALARAFDKLIAHRSQDASSASGGREPQGPESVVPLPESCPEVSAWARLLNGSADASEASALFAHAGACAACAEGLRAESGKATYEEAAELQRMASSSPEWQRGLSGRLAQTPVRVAAMPGGTGQRLKKVQRMPFPRPYIWAGSALAASILIAIGIFVGFALGDLP